MNSLEQDEGQQPSDSEYVLSSRNGCPDHFHLLVQRYQKPLYAYLSSRLGDQSEAEEAAQEAFVRAFMSLKKLRKPESFYAWLIGIAGRVLKEEFRARERRQKDRGVAETLLADNSTSEPEYPLEEAIAVLPESYRQVILLRYYEGLSCQEVALRLQMPLGTVTKTLSRAYALLRQELRDREGVEANVRGKQEL